MDLEPSITHRRKRNIPKRFETITEPCSGARICNNSACRAVLSISDPFCARCSCCICKQYDDNKDPSLWLECAPDSPGRSCGLSCHIKCALEDGKVGVGNICQMMRLDGGYWCSYCGHITGILGCLKKQLTMAKDSRRVDILCYRINLSFKLLHGTSRFQDLLEIVIQAKKKLEDEVGSLDGLSSRMARSLVSRLPVAAGVQELCTAAIRKADELSATLSIASVEGAGQDLWMPDQMVSPGTSKADGSQSTSPRLDLNMAAEPELDADVAPVSVSSMGAADLACGGSENLALVVFNEELPAVNIQAEVARERPASSTEAHGNLNEDVPVNDSSMENADLGCGGSEDRALVPSEELPAVNVQAEVARETPDGTEVHGNLNVYTSLVSDSSMENADLVCGGSVSWAQQGPNEELPAVNVEAEVARVRPGSPEAPGNLDKNYEYCINVIRALEVDNQITSEERQKLFTWYSLRSNEHQRKVVHTYIEVFGSDLICLTEQLFDSFGDAINNSQKPRIGW